MRLTEEQVRDIRELFADHPDVIALLYDHDQLIREVEHLRRWRVVRERGCQCSDDEACSFVRERDAALSRVAVLEEALRLTMLQMSCYDEPPAIARTALPDWLDAEKAAALTGKADS